MINPSDMVFVFGSNLAGAHGAGSAAEAARRGFPYGIGVGHYPMPGNKHGYALPTKDSSIRSLDLAVIRKYVIQLRNFAYIAADKLPPFQITRVGCGLAGYTDEEIAPMFEGIPLDNLYYDSKWHVYLGDAHNYWGTF